MKIPIILVAIEDDGFHLLVKAKINQKPARLLIDTGASKTVFDIQTMNDFVTDLKPQVHDKLSTGLGTNTMVSHTTKVNSIKIGKLEINDLEVVLLDLSHVNTSYKQLELPAITGIIGGDILMKYKAVIHYKEKYLLLND